jgi:hypothetical protein
MKKVPVNNSHNIDPRVFLSGLQCDPFQRVIHVTKGQETCGQPRGSSRDLQYADPSPYSWQMPCSWPHNILAVYFTEPEVLKHVEQ